MLLQLQIKKAKVEITIAANVCFIWRIYANLGKGLLFKDSGKRNK